jgi:hypothetical protein
MMLKRTSFPERPDACMEVAKVESEKGGGGLTIGGIIGAVHGSIVIISIATYPSLVVLYPA